MSGSRGHHARFSALPDRVPEPLSGWGGLRRLPLHGTLAARLCLPRLRRKQSLAAANQGLDLGMRRLWQTDFGDRRHDHAPFQAAADHLVLGGLSDGDPFQRHLGTATATPARSGLVQIGLADGRQAAPQHGGGGRSHQGKILVVGAVEIEDGGAGPGRIRLSQVPDYSARNLHSFLKTNLAPGATAKTDGWSGYPGAPGVNHDPHVVGKMAAHIILPWAHRVFSNLKIWALGVYHGLRRKHLQIYLDEFVFRFNRRHTRHAAFRSLLGIAAAHPPLTYNMLISPEAKA